jgi:hypothetical protein
LTDSIDDLIVRMNVWAREHDALVVRVHAEPEGYGYSADVRFADNSTTWRTHGITCDDVMGQIERDRVMMADKASVASGLIWTSLAPTADGVYWVRDTNSEFKSEIRGTAVLVSGFDYDFAKPRVYYFGVSGADELAKFAGSEWAGPLGLPQ